MWSWWETFHQILLIEEYCQPCPLNGIRWCLLFCFCRPFTLSAQSSVSHFETNRLGNGGHFHKVSSTAWLWNLSCTAWCLRLLTFLVLPKVQMASLVLSTAGNLWSVLLLRLFFFQILVHVSWNTQPIHGLVWNTKGNMYGICGPWMPRCYCQNDTGALKCMPLFSANARCTDESGCKQLPSCESNDVKRSAIQAVRVRLLRQHTESRTRPSYDRTILL